MQGEEVEASFDAAAEAAAAARRLQEADVVLTSFDVLRAEVGVLPAQHQTTLLPYLEWSSRQPAALSLSPGHAACRGSMPMVVPVFVLLRVVSAVLPGTEPSPPPIPPPPLPFQVHFVPSSRSFRRPKKYSVPHCPLLQVGGACLSTCRSVFDVSSVGVLCLTNVAAPSHKRALAFTLPSCSCTGGGW